MSAPWPKVRLGEVLVECREIPEPEGLVNGSMRIVSKISFDSGKIEVRQKAGTKTGMILVRPGDLLVSGIKAAKEATAIYGRENTEPVAATIHYGAYGVDEDRADIRYLWWYLRSRPFREILFEALPGGIKTEIKASCLLPIRVAIPTLSEQRRIVARIEELAAKINEARKLRREATEEAAAFVSSLHINLARGRTVRLNEILTLDEIRQEVQLGRYYPRVGVKGFGQGLFERETLEGAGTTYKAFNRLYDGAVVLSQVKGWEGAIAVCPSDLAGRFVSPEYRTFRCTPDKAIPEYLSILVGNPWFWRRLSDLTRGVGARRERTRPEQFLRMELPMPSIEEQRFAIPIFTRFEQFKRLQAETAAELDALLPSILDKAFKGEL